MASGTPPHDDERSPSPGPDGRRVGASRARWRFVRELTRASGFVPRMVIAMPFQGRERARTRTLLGQGESTNPEDQRRKNDDARRRFRERVARTSERGGRHVAASTFSASTFSARRIFVSCGEPSGETHAVDFVRCMRRLSPESTFLGFGGNVLEQAGVSVRQNLVDHAVMGFRAVLGQVPFFARVVARFVQILTEERPDVVVLVDYPGLHLILAEEARRLGIPVLYYVCPQYWAWAPWRMRRFRRAVDGAIAILPFEPPLFERHGIPTAFAGNPLLAHLPELAPEPRDELLAILPGSRRSELVRHLGPVIDIWRRFHARHPSARAILPQQGERRAARVREALTAIEADTGTIPALEITDEGAFDVLARARAALVKSGTSTLQTALCRTPQVVFYKTSGRSEMLFAKGFLSTAWIAAPNLVLGRDAIPERYFASANAWSAIEADLEAIWSEGPSRQSQLSACDEIRDRVRGDGAGREVARWLVDDDCAQRSLT